MSFGWTDSPRQYRVAINHLHTSREYSQHNSSSRIAATFDGKVWCDDHNCVDPAIGTRLEEAAVSLRCAMVRILGPNACNEQKFTDWFDVGTTLGLVWDIPNKELSMPRSKILKAITRLEQMVVSVSTTCTKCNQLVGSLRHVATFVRTAAPFMLRLAALARRAPRYLSVATSQGAKEDAKWFLAILRASNLNRIPLTRFIQSTAPSIDIFMDACDQGLCALFPARQQFLQVQFDDAELRLIQQFKAGSPSDLGINTRELMSTVFASLVWGSSWASHMSSPDMHVRFWIDNEAAVTWNNKRSSRNEFAQMLLRILALLEVHQLLRHGGPHSGRGERYGRRRQSGVGGTSNGRAVC